MHDPTAGTVISRVDGESPREAGPVEDGRVYAMLDRDACQIKIGFTERQPLVRMAEIEAQSGRRLELLGSLRGGRSLERALHGRFAASRVEALGWYSSEIIGELGPLLEEVDR